MIESRLGCLPTPARAVLLGLVALSLSCGTRTPAPASGAQAGGNDSPGAVGALGRIEPGDGITVIAARSLSGQASIVGKLLVREGDRVKAGQVVAELDSRNQLEAAAREAAARIEVARRRLAQVQAGAKASDVAAQQAEIERLEVDLGIARQEERRYGSLGEHVTELQRETRRARVDSLAHALNAARQRLASLSEVRAVDVELARAGVEEATRSEARARAELEASLIRSPIDGRVIKVHARPGEQVQAEGLMEIAPTDPMYVVAEIVESDIGRVKLGQRATISGDGLPAALEGSVARIGSKVLQNELMRLDPATFSDGRVVNVWIEVDEGEAVANLIHLRVDVVIHP